MIREYYSSPALWRQKWGSRALKYSRNRAPNWQLRPHPQPRATSINREAQYGPQTMAFMVKIVFSVQQSSQWTKFCTWNPRAPGLHTAIECVLFDITMSNLKKLSEGLGKLPRGTAWHELLKLFDMELLSYVVVFVCCLLWGRQTTVFDSNVSEVW